MRFKADFYHNRNDYSKDYFKWGPIPIAVQKVGSQIESISWMTAGGFQSAMSAFIGQNYGAKKWDRVFKGYFTGIGIVSVIGIFATCLLILEQSLCFPFYIGRGSTYVWHRISKNIRIISLFMCVEITTAGAFIGHGKTLPPSFVGILFNVLRIPAALMLSSTFLGLSGVWWAISVSSILKALY